MVPYKWIDMPSYITRKCPFSRWLPETSTGRETARAHPRKSRAHVLLSRVLASSKKTPLVMINFYCEENKYILWVYLFIKCIVMNSGSVLVSFSYFFFFFPTWYSPHSPHTDDAFERESKGRLVSLGWKGAGRETCLAPSEDRIFWVLY